MRKILFLIICFGVFQTLQSQTVQPKTSVEDENKLYSATGIEVLPVFPGGIKEFYQFIGKNYKVPDVPGLKGKIYISFVIEKDGSLTNIKILRDIGYGTGIEAVRVLNLSPKWTPAEQNQRTVRCSYVLPLSIEASK